MKDQLKILTGNTHPCLAQNIARHLDVPPGEALVQRFPGGETQVQITENVRGKDVFVVQSVCANANADIALSPNDSLMELLILIDAARRASARRITAVVPYYGYARQDRKDRPRVPITAKLAGNLLVTSGANRLLTIDLHSNQVQGFFDIPVDHLYSIKIFVDYFRRKAIPNLIVVSPDVGGIKMARAYSALLDVPLAVVDKRRSSGTKTEVMNVIGDIKGKNVIIVDDLISTGGSLVSAAAALRQKGAGKIYAAIVHPVLAHPAIDRLADSVLEELVVVDTIPISHRDLERARITLLSVAPMLAEAIRRIHRDESVSDLFANAQVEG